MDEYLDDLKAGKIQFRDKWQFELKTEFFPDARLKKNNLIQEFYFFIPNALQVSDQTYTKAQFYLDQTNLIRLKTPTFTFKELIDPDNADSPLVRILMITDYVQSQDNAEQIQEEIKLLGNIFHSALREKIAELAGRYKLLKTLESKDKFKAAFHQFFEELEQFRHQFFAVQKKFLSLWSLDALKNEFTCVDEFISNSIHEYLIWFLNLIRIDQKPDLNDIDQQLCKVIATEANYRKEKFGQSIALTSDPQHNEYLLYRQGLLSKFMLNPLLLRTSRASVDQRLRGFILGIPAAIAMLIFLLLYVWQGNVFLLNSQPFILLTVFIYVLKDRLKEELRALSYRQAAKWFSDYTTEIMPQENNTVLGKVTESFSFVEEGKVPTEIIDIRNREFHGVLETFKRPERIFYYKKTVSIQKKPQKVESRFYGLSLIFRFDIHHFLSKAEDPYQSILSLDPATGSLQKTKLPRVYHLNIIMKTTQVLPFGKSKIDLKKFRLVIDKNGIKRVENF